MKNNKEKMPVSVFSTRCFMVGLLVMTAAWAVCLVGTHLIWSHGGSGLAQAGLTLGLLTVFPSVGAVGLIALAVRTIGAYRRMFVSVGLGMALGGALLTVVMFSSANRRAAVERIFAVVKE